MTTFYLYGTFIPLEKGKLYCTCNIRRSALLHTEGLSMYMRVEQVSRLLHGNRKGI